MFALELVINLFSTQKSSIHIHLLQFIDRRQIHSEILHRIMEMERVAEFPMSNVDIGPRKRQRLGWDVVHPAPKVLDRLRFLQICLICLVFCLLF